LKGRRAPLIAGFITIPVVSFLKLSVKLSEIKGYLRGIKLNSKAVSKSNFEFFYKKGGYYASYSIINYKKLNVSH
jgi:hypothetical protein